MTQDTAMMKTDELLAVLDEDIRHLEKALSQLDALRGMLIRRDEAELDRLLMEIRREGQAYAANEYRRQHLRMELARVLGCEHGRLTLSTLQAALPDARRASVAQRQARLASLVGRLKREYALTVMLVSDFARFNRSLMATLVGSGGKGAVTYTPSGVAQHGVGKTLMSLQL